MIMKLINILSLAVVASSVLGCSSTTQIASPVDGFQAFTSARDFDPPGQIFRVDEQGQTWPVSTLNFDIKTGNEDTLEISKDVNITLKGLIKTIGVAEETLPAEVKANLQKTVSTKLSSVSGTREYLQDDSGIDSAISALFKNVKYRPNNQYYIIRETISTNSINFSSKDSWTNDASLNAEIKKVVDVNAGTNLSAGEGASLVKNFNKPMRVWYKAEKIKLKSASGIGPTSVLKFAIVETDEEIPNLQTEKQSANP
jgi:hypothetical protein